MRGTTGGVAGWRANLFSKTGVLGVGNKAILFIPAQ